MSVSGNSSSEEIDNSSGEENESEPGCESTSDSMTESERSALVPYSFEPSETESDHSSDS